MASFNCSDRSRLHWCVGLLLSLGMLLVVMAITAGLTSPIFVKRFILDEEDLDPSMQSSKLESWRNFHGAEMYTKFYLFNLTNELDFQEGQNPVFEELGPYVYREKRQRVNVHSKVKDHVSYQTSTTYHFVPEMSNGSDWDTVVMPYVPQIAQSVIDTRSVHDWLWGYHNEDGNFFGLYTGRNATYRDEFEVMLGPTDSYGLISHYNGLAELPYWNTTEANSISGTDGTFFKPYGYLTSSLSEMFWKQGLINKTFHVLDTDFCRTLPLSIKKCVPYKGVKAHRYAPHRTTLYRNASHNEGFCSGQDDEVANPSMCNGYPVFDVQNCRNNVPYGMSWPHYYQSLPQDPNSMNLTVDGISPAEEDLHEFYVDIQPETGIPLRLRRRVQFNLLLNKTSNNAMPMVYPLFWIESGYDTLPLNVFHQLRVISLLTFSAILCSLAAAMFFFLTQMILAVGLYCCCLPNSRWSYVPALYSSEPMKTKEF